MTGYETAAIIAAAGASLAAILGILYFPRLSRYARGERECPHCETTGLVTTKNTARETARQTCWVCGGKGWLAP